MNQLRREAYNHVEGRGSQGKRNGNGGDLVHGSFEVSVPMDALEQPLLLQKLLSWPKWCFRQHDTAKSTQKKTIKTQ